MFSLPGCKLPSSPLPWTQQEQEQGLLFSSPAWKEADFVLLTSDTLKGLAGKK
jgi:hypothetical protein